MMVGTSESGQTAPYVGPRPLRPGERIYGREAEIRELFHLLKAQRIVLLHSPSGAGKSSLVYAGLIPRLKAARFDVWRPIRVNLSPAEFGAEGPVNRYVASAILSLEEGLPRGKRRPPAELTGQSLKGYVVHRPRRPAAPSSVLLVLDQFEELLTVDPLELEAKAEFFRQLGELLRDRRYWALFVMREDYLAALDPYRDHVPTRLANTFRIDRLGREAATEAVTEPARAAGREFAEQVAERLVNDLATTSVQQADGSFALRVGNHVEPVQLQVVCLRLWNQLPDDAEKITQDHVDQLGDVSQTLSDYYADQVGRIADGSVSRERSIRRWFSKQLITAGDIRGQVLKREGESGGLDNDLVQQIQDAHLVRAERRAGATWYELAHDRLVSPVKRSNEAWFESHLHLVQRHAATWEQQGRPDELLLRGAALELGTSWAKTTDELLPVEKDLLERSLARSRRERRRRIGAIAVFVLLASVSLGLVAGIMWALSEKSRSMNLAKLNLSSSLVGEAYRAFREDDYGLAAVLAVQAQRFRDELPKEIKSDDPDTGTIRALRLSLLAGRSGRRLEEHDDVVRGIELSPDGRWMASAGEDARVKLWDLEKRALVHDIELPGPARAISFRRDSAWLACAISFRCDSALQDCGRLDDKVSLIPVEDRVLLDAAGEDGFVELSLTDTGQLPARDIRTVAYHPLREDVLVTAGTKGALHLLRLPKVASDLERSLAPQPIVIGDVDVREAAFSPDGRWLATADSLGDVRLFELVDGDDGGASLVELRKAAERKAHPKRALSVAWSPDGRQLASAGPVRGEVDGWVLWSFDPVGRGPTSCDGCLKVHRVVETPRLGINRLRFDRSGQKLVAGTTGGKLVEWDLESLGGPDSKSAPRMIFDGHRGQVELTLWPASADDLSRRAAEAPFASAGFAGDVRYWRKRPRTVHRPIEHGTEVHSVALAPKPLGLLAFGDAKGWVRVVDLTGKTEFEPLKPLSTPGQPVRVLAFSPDGKYLAWGGSDKTVRLWQVGLDLAPQTLLATVDGVWALAFTGGDSWRRRPWLAAGGYDKKVHLWHVDDLSDSETPEPRWTDELDRPVLSLTFSPDGERLVAATGKVESGRLALWALDEDGRALEAPAFLRFRDDGDLVDTHLGFKYQFRGVAFQPAPVGGSNTLAAASGDGLIRLWDLDRATCSYAALDAKLLGVVKSVSFDPGGEFLAAGHADGTISVWGVPAYESNDCQETRIEKGVTRLSRESSHNGPVNALQFSHDPEDVRLASVGRDGVVHLHEDVLWQDVDELVNRACEVTWRNLTRKEWEKYVGQEDDFPYQCTCPDLPCEKSSADGGR